MRSLPSREPRTRRRARRLPLLSGALIAIALLAWGIPWLTRERTDTTSTPTPPPFQSIAPIVLKPGQQACESLVALSPDTRVATVLAAKFTGQGPPLRVTASAPGYRARADIAGGYRGLGSMQATLERPPPRNAIGTICVRNAGHRPVPLQGTTEGRIQNRSATSVDGKVIPAKMTLLLTEAQPRSLADRPGQILERIAAFKPPIVGSVSLSILALLVLLGVPAGVVYAVWRGIAAED
jgi:hypothetical protein